MTLYKPYSATEVSELIHNVREISTNPYMLHAAFLLSCVFEAIDQDVDDEEGLAPEQMFGMKIPRFILDRIVKNANEQFISSIKAGEQIDVWDKAYSIRKAKNIDVNRLCDVFQFEQDEDDCIISKHGIINLSEIAEQPTYDEVKADRKDSVSYLRKVIKTAEDDDNDGWSKLTDIEVSMYLWAKFYHKHSVNDYERFRKVYKKHLYANEEEERECWNHASSSKGSPNGICPFSAEKVRRWNSDNNQESVVESISNEDADNYWYDVALKSSFK